VWLGQVVSLLGTAMSGFGLTIWAYERTGQATALALVGFFFMTPMLVISPVAGALVDRSNRKLMMMVSDLASGISTIIVIFLYASGHLEVWHLYITNALMGLGQAFQWPAFSAAITTMMPKEQYGRANGLMALAESGSGIFAPILAGAMLAFIGLGGILMSDVTCLVSAVLALLGVHVPQPKITAAGKASQGSLWKESAFGLQYILKHPSLLGLQLVFLVGNFAASVAFTLMAAMILARTNNNEMALGSVNSIGAAGGVLGGVLMSAWGGTKKKVHGVLTGWILSGLLGTVLMGLGQGVVIWATAAFLGNMLIPWINGSNQAIWQAKVAPDVQGRVFSIRRLIAWFSNPLAMLIAGPLADRMLEPAMRTGGALVPTFAWLVGSGPGAGMSLVFIFAGLVSAMVGGIGYLLPVVRDAEQLMPDYDEPAEGETRDGETPRGARVAEA